MMFFTRIQNCPNRIFSTVLFLWWTALCVLYLRQSSEPEPVPIPQRRIRNFSDDERRLLEQQNCVRNTAPCPRLKLNRTDQHLVDFPNFRYFCVFLLFLIKYSESYHKHTFALKGMHPPCLLSLRCYKCIMAL